MPSRPPILVALALAIVRAAAWLVPRGDRELFRREWTAEIVHGQRNSAQSESPTEAQMSLVRRSFGALPDAAWIRRQFTRDSELLHDIRHGLRLYRRAPAMFALIVGVLAVGIGASTAVFHAVDTLLLQPMPYADADRVAFVWQRSPDGHKGDVAPADFVDLQQRVRAFTTLAAAEPYGRDYLDGGEPEVLTGARVTEGFFDSLRAEPVLGRLFNAEDYRTRRNVVIISEGLWQRRLARAPDIVGRTIRLDEGTFEVVGVLPKTFEPRVLWQKQDIWTTKAVIEQYELQSRGSGYWNVVGKLAPGVTLEQATQELDAVSAQIGVEHPKTNARLRAFAMPLRTHLANGAERPLALLAIGAGLILLLAIGSAATLQMTQLSGRLQEFMVRAALGAHRQRLVRQVLAEAMTMVAVAVGVGVLLSAGLMKMIQAVGPDTLALPTDSGVTVRLVLFASLLGGVTVLLSGLAPLFVMLPARSSSRLSGTLSSRGSASHAYGRSALVVAQIALAAVLLVSAGLLARSFMKVLAIDPGIATRNLIAAQVFAYDRNETAAKRTAFFAETIERIKALPGVDAVGAASTVPFLQADIDILSPITIVGAEPPATGEVQRVYLASATPDYFGAAGIALRRGRGFTAADVMGAEIVAVVNEAAALKFWRGEDPIGRSIEITDYGRKKIARVVGVIAELRYGGLEGKSRPEVFLPHAQSPSAAMTYVVRAAVDPAAMLPAIKKAVWSVDPLQTFYETGAVTDMVRHSLRTRIFALRLVLALAGIGFVIALAGAHGAVLWALRRRTAEFGVRMALGARGADIRRHMLSFAGRLAITGIALGLIAAGVLSGLLRGLLFDIAPWDPMTFAGIAAGLLIAVFAACALPAIRAGRIDPVAALK
ncbi:MAG TPA: ABC transporter permease [Vicinamibacterales bacterium]|nr:ABC transporter permease [Vicinamibacterales bacterium]